VNLAELNLTTAVDLFLLLLIGIGPKIALVPFLDATSNLDQVTKGRVIQKMLITAFATALVLMIFGGVLSRLLHFSTAALAISSGLILIALSIPMVIGNNHNHAETAGKDPLSLAVSPLAIPYLLNPVGIVLLITISAETTTLSAFGLVLAVLILVLAIDTIVFRWANRVSGQLDESRMIVIEKVFGFLLAALAVQLALHGLETLGLIHLAVH
jgi:small neutral amino acid transporter SnatA (MarC family)